MSIFFKDFTIVNESRSFKGSLTVANGRIHNILSADETPEYAAKTAEAAAECGETIEGGDGAYLLPGVIDDQVHFREPGATQKGCIASESAAAVLGGTTSFMDMPNNNPPVCTVEALENKYNIATRDSYANYSFYMGATNDNIAEIRKVSPENVCGIKVFMGSSTGNMLVDSPEALKDIFSQRDMLVATHCEDEATIRHNLDEAKQRWGEKIPFSAHPLIRSREACLKSTMKALDLAVKYGTRLHVLHVSTAEEIEAIKQAQDSNPLITFELCAHYLWFDSSMYDEYGSKMKCNPAVKDASDKAAIIEAVRTSATAAVATDHAPHLLSEKMQDYLHAPSGLPTIQNTLQLMLELSEKGLFQMAQVVKVLSHSPADTFGVRERGYIREGYHADLVIVRNQPFTVCKENIAYRCGWSPFEGHTFPHTITDTFVNGIHTVSNGRLTGVKAPERLMFKL